MFVDSCAKSVVFDADGDNLLQYDIYVDMDGNLIVDLNQDKAKPQQDGWASAAKTCISPYAQLGDIPQAKQQEPKVTEIDAEEKTQKRSAN